MSSIRFVPLCALLACGGASMMDEQVHFTESAALELTSASGAFHLAIDTDVDNPPGRGVNVFRFRISDDAGPVDGLSFTVTPWMPVMGHGSAVEPTVEPLGDGRYIVGRVYLAMPGTWDLRTMLLNDHVEPRFEIL